jgi:hypothetical protein
MARPAPVYPPTLPGKSISDDGLAVLDTEMTDSTSTRAEPTWTTWSQAVALIVRGATFSVSIRIALVVGTLLSAVNQGSAIIDGDTSTSTWVRVGFNYLVPYVVASIGYLAPLRQRRSGTA